MILHILDHVNALCDTSIICVVSSLLYILLQQERFEDLTKMADELDAENYRGKDAIRKKEKDILKKWSELLDLLNKHKVHLQNCCDLVAIMREVDTITASIRELEVSEISFFFCDTYTKICFDFDWGFDLI